LIVRPADTTDARGIAEVHVETWRATYGGVMPQHVLDELDVGERERMWTRLIAHADLSVFVAESEGRTVGFANVGACRDEPATGELYAIYVRPSLHGSGAGQALMDASVRWLAERWDEAVLWVATENPRARRFYERNEWTVDGERVDESLVGAPLPETRYRLSGLKRR
jgi:ribosomal protein S18 acetylase RimI-like enzyme